MRVIGIFLGIVFFALIIVNRKLESDREGDYFKTLGLRMTGVIKNDPDCPNGYNGFCVLSVDVIQSNVPEHDPRNKFPVYYCIIKDKQAEIYQASGMLNCMKGDTVVIDTREKTFQVFRTGRTIPILLNDDPRWYNYL